MFEWIRVSSMESRPLNYETWILKKDAKEIRKYSVRVKHGKNIDITGLKLNAVEDFERELRDVQLSRKTFMKNCTLEKVTHCPICKNEYKETHEGFMVYGLKYCHCNYCSHYFISPRPGEKDIKYFYSESEQYQSTYTDSEKADIRVKEVAIPKARWLVDQFQREYNRNPKKILDVGAGSGHFVRACRMLGLDAEGIELSRPGIEFCKNNFDIQLAKVDFLKDYGQYKDFDVISFWGVIEHGPNPLQMLETANQVLKGREALVIAAVPVWDCLSTTIQKIFPDNVIRHLEPVGHINCFTVSSLATAFSLSQFDPVAAWNYGMDIYELTMQLAHATDSNKVIRTMQACLPKLQETLDMAGASDEFVLAGRPEQ